MILFATQNFLPSTGGIQTYVTGLADALASRGHRVVVFCDATSATADSSADSIRNYPIHRHSGPKLWRRRRKASAISRRLKEGDVRVVIADTWKSLEGLPATALENTRVLCLAHGAELLSQPESPKGRRIQKSFGKADLIGANSRFTAELVAPFARQASEIRVLWPGVELPSGADSTVAPRPPSQRRHLLTIARLDPYKGVDNVLRAMPFLLPRCPNLTYDVVGDGHDLARLSTLVRRLKIQDSVHFHGKVSESKKADLLRQCEIFVLANRREPGEVEGFGIVLAEAGAFGKPAIAGKDGGTGDAVVHGRTGLLVDGDQPSAIEQALALLLEDGELAAAMGSAARERFWAEFIWSAAISRFEAAIFP